MASASSSSASRAAPAQAPFPAHPAFPSLIPSFARGLPTAPSKHIPTNPSQVLNLINTAQTPQDVYHVLIPALKAVAAPSGGKRKDADKASTKGEEILALFDQDLSKVGEDDFRDRAAGLVFVLSARLHPRHADQPTYTADSLALATDLCIAGNPDQLRLCGPRCAVTDLAWGILRLAKHLKTPGSALAPLQSLLHQVIEPTALSGVHAAYLEACLLTRRYDEAQEIIHRIYVDVKTMQPTYLDVITFFHHAGLISAAVKDWEKALEMFSIAVSVPTSAASAVQLACAKRAILCGLLHDGKFVHFPKYTASAVSRVIERNAKEYVKLAEAFVKEDWKTVRTASSIKEFKDDANLGLLDQVIASIPIRRVLKLKRYYSKLRISDVADKLDLKDAKDVQDVEALTHYMISNEIIRATIEGSGPAAIITFMEDDMDYTSPQALSRLKQINAISTWLEQELTKGGRELGIHRDYLKKQAQLLDNAGGKNGKGGNGDPTDIVMSEDAKSGGFRSGGGKMKGVGGNMADFGF